jgi:DNA-binding NarL/FixJ family response regulator
VSRVLIVDDHPGVRAVLRAVVSARADEVFECTRGEDAEAAVGVHRPDLVLMDIDMPGGMDGITATRAICTRFPGVRVAIVTQHDAVELRDAAARAGACGYLLKDNLIDVLSILSTANENQGETQ